MKEYYVDLIKLPKGINRKEAHINAVKRAMEMGYRNVYDSLNTEYDLTYMHLWASGEITFGSEVQSSAISYDAFMKRQNEKKIISCKIDLCWLKGQAREVISEAIQKKLFEAGCKWYEGQTSPILKDYPYLKVDTDSIGCRMDKEDFDSWSVPEVSVNNALKGNFWTYSSIPKKEEPKPEGYKVSLASYTGKAREAISKAIQKEAFKKGFSWNGEKKAQHTDETHLYFWMSDHCICWDNDQRYFDAYKYKELSVEEILSGALPKVN